MASPAALECARIHVVDEHALPIDQVNFTRVLVEIEAALGYEHIGLRVVFLQRRPIFRRAMAEVPQELPVGREFEDAVLRRRSGDPDVSFAVHEDGLQRRRPLRNISRAAPGVDHIALGIEFDGLGTAHAASDARRIAVAADFIAVGRRAAIQEPDVVVLFVHVQTRHLLHAPAIRQALGPVSDRRGTSAPPARP